LQGLSWQLKVSNTVSISMMLTLFIWSFQFPKDNIICFGIYLLLLNMRMLMILIATMI